MEGEDILLPPPEEPEPEIPLEHRKPLNIDNALADLMKRLKRTGDEAIAPDTAVKIINAAVAWEKVKYQIKDATNGFNPDDL